VTGVQTCALPIYRDPADLQPTQQAGQPRDEPPEQETCDHREPDPGRQPPVEGRELPCRRRRCSAYDLIRHASILTAVDPGVELRSKGRMSGLSYVRGRGGVPV